MQSVQVTIFDQVYTLKGQDDPAYIRELASFIDAKMKEIQKGTGTTDPHRVAILAALTISDELYRMRKQYHGLEQETGHALDRILEMTEPEKKDPDRLF